MLNPKSETINSKQTQNTKPKIQNLIHFGYLDFEFWICLGFRI
jgi:hypothetical protein